MRLTHFDGNPLNVPNIGFKCAVSTRLDSYSSSVRRRDRASFTPARQDTRPQYRQIQITCWPPDDNVNISFDDFRHAVYSMFDPFRGERELRATWEHEEPEDNIDMFVRCDVTDVRWDSQSKRADVTLEATEPSWKSVELFESNSSPITIQGNTITRPRITISGTGVGVNRNRYLVIDRTGRGITAWPTPFPITSNVSEVYVNGVSVPFVVAGSNTWAYIHVHPARPTTVDIYTGSTASPGAGKMDFGQLNLIASSGTTHAYQNNWIISANPGAASCQWHLANPIPFRERAGPITYEVSSESASVIAFRLWSRQQQRSTVAFANDYTGVEFTSPVEILSIDGLLRRHIVHSKIVLIGGFSWGATVSGRMRTMERRAEQEKWSNIHVDDVFNSFHPLVGVSGQGYDTTHSFPIITNNAIQVAIALDVPNLSTVIHAAEGRQFEAPTFALSHMHITGSPVVQYDSSKVPQVLHVGSTSSRFIEQGVLRNERTQDRIVLERVYSDGPLVIDADRLAIGSETGVDNGRIRSSGGVRYFDLVPGENEWTRSGSIEVGGSVNVEWRERRGL